MTADTPAVRLGVLSDLHLAPDPGRRLAWHNEFDLTGVLPRLSLALDWFAEREVDAVLALGDLSNDGDLESLAAALAALAAGWDGPTLVLAGNHDLERRPDALELALAATAASGIELAGPGGVELGGLRIAALGDATAVPTAGPLVLLSHWPLISRASAFAAAGLAYAGDLEGGESVLAAFQAARSAPTLLLNGHLHARDSASAGALLQMTVGALVEAPYEASVITVRAAGATLSAEREVRELPGPEAAGPVPALVPATETRSVRAMS